MNFNGVLLLLLCSQLCNALAINNSCAAPGICLPDNYDKLQRPVQDKPVDVKVDLDVTQFLDINDLEFTLTFSMYFGVRWEEPRLESDPNEEKDLYLPVDLSFFNELWVPDVYIYNLKEIHSYKIFTDFAGKIEIYAYISQFNFLIQVCMWSIEAPFCILMKLM